MPKKQEPGKRKMDNGIMVYFLPEVKAALMAAKRPGESDSSVVNGVCYDALIRARIMRDKGK